MKLTTLKKVHVVFCLTCVYSVHHGWANDASLDNLENRIGGEFHEVTKKEAEEVTKQSAANIVAAPPSEKNSIVWDYTLGFVWPKAKPSTDATKIILKATELLRPETEEGKNIVAATIIMTDNHLVTATRKTSALEHNDDLSEEESSDGSEDSDIEEDSVTDTSVHENSIKRTSELNPTASKSPIQDVAEEESDEESDEEVEDKNEAAPIEDISSSVISSTAITSENDVDPNLATKLVEEYCDAPKIEHKQVPSIMENENTLAPLSTHLTSGQEGKGSHIFNQGHDGSGILDARIMALLSEKVVSATQVLSEGTEQVMQALGETIMKAWENPDFWKNLVGEPGDYKGDYSSPFV